MQVRRRRDTVGSREASQFRQAGREGTPRHRARLALRGQSARTIPAPNLTCARVPTNESTISLTSFIAQFDWFSSHASGLMGGRNHETTVDTPLRIEPFGTRAAVEAKCRVQPPAACIRLSSARVERSLFTSRPACRYPADCMPNAKRRATLRDGGAEWPHPPSSRATFPAICRASVPTSCKNPETGMRIPMKCRRDCGLGIPCSPIVVRWPTIGSSPGW